MNYSHEKPTLVLITPAWNEQDFIETTIKSVVSQTEVPLKWVIVDDGSTDRTGDIVKGYAAKISWIELVQLSEHRERSFAAKVAAFNEGFRRLNELEYDVIGNLDADISFDSGYFEYLLDRFAENPRLGVAGTPFVEEGYSSINDSYEGGRHVPGGCQLFRRACFKDVGGYIPVKGGGIDWIAVTTARMKGWQTQSFPEKHFIHYRTLGTGNRSPLGAIMDYGLKDYYLGGHPLWQFFRVGYRIKCKPYLVGGLAVMLGYLKGASRRIKRPVSPELMRFHRGEQMEKLRQILGAALKMKRIRKFQSASLAAKLGSN